MDSRAEHLIKTAENFYFQLDFIHNLQDQTSHIRRLRVLDFGAGSSLVPINHFNMLQKDQEVVVAYDPLVAVPAHNPGGVFGAEVRQTNQPPVGEKFHLVVCNFSLHHIGEDLRSTIGGLAAYSPEVIGIADYDFTGSTREDFERTFISEQESKELETLFKGDWRACFDYHRRWGAGDFKRGLQELGFNLVVSKNGNGLAKNKFYLIGKRL